jgi:transcription elongation factor GreA
MSSCIINNKKILRVAIMYDTPYFVNLESQSQELAETTFNEAKKKLEDELQDLKVVKRREIAQKIKEAREQGDLSENAEYDAAKDEQRDIEARIEEIEKILKNAEVVVEEEVDLEKISIGCKVKILDCEFNDELEYKIVGSTEANSLKGKISNESPVGRALLGKKVGDTITVETQAGELSYKVLEIQRSTVD